LGLCELLHIQPPAFSSTYGSNLWPELGTQAAAGKAAVIGILHSRSSDTNADRLRAFRKSLARWRQELSGTIAQCLNLEHEIHHNGSKLCILGVEPLE
jgi:hypothetical protein